MKTIKREDFIQENKYIDSPQYLGYGATISAPHMHAVALELLSTHLEKGKKCLDIGSGSGYLTLAFYKLMEKDEEVFSYGIEHIPQLVQTSLFNINKTHPQLIANKQIQIFTADGRQGLSQYAPFDCIHVGAAATQIPISLIQQLNYGGRMLIPVGNQGYAQSFLVIDKDLQGNLSQKEHFQVQYVPLTDSHLQYPHQN